MEYGNMIQTWALSTPMYLFNGWVIIQWTGWREQLRWSQPFMASKNANKSCLLSSTWMITNHAAYEVSWFSSFPQCEYGSIYWGGWFIANRLKESKSVVPQCTPGLFFLDPYPCGRTHGHSGGLPLSFFVDELPVSPLRVQAASSLQVQLLFTANRWFFWIRCQIQTGPKL